MPAGSETSQKRLAASSEASECLSGSNESALLVNGRDVLQRQPHLSQLPCCFLWGAGGQYTIKIFLFNLRVVLDLEQSQIQASSSKLSTSGSIMQKPQLRRCFTHKLAPVQSSEMGAFHRYVLTYASSQCRLRTGRGKTAKYLLVGGVSMLLVSHCHGHRDPRCLLLNAHASTLHICGSSWSGLLWSLALSSADCSGGDRWRLQYQTQC